MMRIIIHSGGSDGDGSDGGSDGDGSDDGSDGGSDDGDSDDEYAPRSHI